MFSGNNNTIQGGNNAYNIQNVGTLVVPIRTNANFPLLRTLNEAIVLAEQEILIKEELEKTIKEREKENEILTNNKKMEATGGASQLSDFGGKIVFLVIPFIASYFL